MIVVTGGVGFIGSVLVGSLNQAGYNDILVVDELGDQGQWKNLRGKTVSEIVRPFVFKEDLLAGKYDDKIEAIIHIGAITDTSFPDADELYRKNTRFTRHLATWCLDHDVRFIYASSASVYGDGNFGFSDSDELTPKLLPMNPYAFSKWAFDTEAINKGWNDKIVGLRFFNVFGPNEYHKGRMASVILHATRQIKEKGSMELFQSHKEGYGDGEQKRDFVYIKDVCKVIIWFLQNPAKNGIYNLGTGKARTFKDLAKATFAALNIPENITFVPTPENIRNSYQYFTEADMSKLRDAGYTEEFYSLEDAVADYVHTYLQNEANPYF